MNFFKQKELEHAYDVLEMVERHRNSPEPINKATEGLLEMLEQAAQKTISKHEPKFKIVD